MKISKEALNVIIEFCANQRECCFCPFFSHRNLSCNLQNEKKEIPEKWEVKDELERMD